MADDDQYTEEGISAIRGTLQERSELQRAARGAMWGVVAAAAMAVIMLLGAIGGDRNRLPFPVLILSQVMHHRPGLGAWLLGGLCHFVYGAIAGMVFSYFSRPMTLAKGIGYGIVLWFFMGITFLPWLEWGDMGVRHPVLMFYFLFLHIVFGGVLGGLGARDEQAHDQRFDDLGRIYNPPGVEERHTVRVH